MTPTGKARRSDALYYGHDEGINRRWLCDKVAALESDNDELRERVAELEELTDGKRYIPQEWYQLVTTENANMRELATYALRYIVEVWCDGEGRELGRGKPCEDCVDAGSSDCPKCMPRVFDVSGIEVDG